MKNPEPRPGSPSSARSLRASTPLRVSTLGVLPALAALALGSCNLGGGSGGGGGSTTPPGTPGMKPGTNELFFHDAHAMGAATRLRTQQMFWGRVVDVHDIDAATGEVDPVPTLQDYVVNENIQTDNIDYVVETNPITQETRLIILRTQGDGTQAFESLARAAASNMPPVQPKPDSVTTPPISFLARNSALVIRFSDLLDDSDEAALAQTVKVFQGYPPTRVVEPRIFFDPNHGGLAGGSFHSTRVVIDMTVSEAELVGSPISLPINGLGLDASLLTPIALTQPNVSVRIPSRTDPAAAQFELLTTLAGKPMATSDNGPVDFGSPTLDVVRGMRSGNQNDANNGFLLDLKPPQVVGSWSIAIQSAVFDPSGSAGFDFIIGLRFTSPCRSQPQEGDIIELADTFLEVTAVAGIPDPVTGEVSDVRVRLLATEAQGDPARLLGLGSFLSTFSPGLLVDDACWYQFTPVPMLPPDRGISLESVVRLRFSEPMDPDSVLPFDSFQLIQGGRFETPAATNTVVGKIQPSANLKEFNFEPILPFDHAGMGQEEIYHIDLRDGPRGPTDLAGNPLLDAVPIVEFRTSATEPATPVGSVVLRFDSANEFTVDDPDPVMGNPDVRGQFFFDPDLGLLKPREVAHVGVPHDNTNPIVGQMTNFPRGIQTPLSPLGSKLQAVFRYADMGWLITDETKYNVDVEGLNWSPAAGQVLADTYPEFEIRLSHSNKLPDEYVDSNRLPVNPTSGVSPFREAFDTNILVDIASPQKIVHAKPLGYTLNPADLFLGATGTPLMPYPLNRAGGPYETYTWRDTSALRVGGPRGKGLPMEVESKGLCLYPALGKAGGELYPRDFVPTIGLPLLVEIRCYPSSEGVGLNAFNINLAINNSAEPNFRAYSTGGIDQGFNRITVNPDEAVVPTGGYNPGSNPPGRRTRRVADNTFYIGQLDIVFRISRVYTIWLNTQTPFPDFKEPVIEPAPDAQPSGTRLIAEYRGATSILDTDPPTGDAFNANGLTAYGNPSSRDVTVSYLNNFQAWTSDIHAIDSATYFQVRFTFINNLDTGLNPVLSAFGVGFEKR